MLDNYITGATDGLGQFQLQLESVGEKLPNWEPAADSGLWALSDPRLSSPARMRKKCCYGQKNLGSICSSLSPSPTHLSHTTNINPFENKVWEIYLYKEVCSFVHWSLSLCLIMFRIYLYYVYVCGYTTRIVQVRLPRYPPNPTPCDFFLFPKLKIHHIDKIWGCGGHKKKYGCAASKHIKREVS